MSVSQLAGPFGEWRSATPATGAAITAGATTPAHFIALPPGTHYVSMEGRNYSTAVVVRWTTNPWLTVLKTTDDLATAANATDYSGEAQDGDTATDVTLSSFATSHALWVGAALPFRGVYADVDSANGSAATVAATYWTTGATMASLTVTDGTASGGATFAVDGGITWTVPADWQPATLRTVGGAHVDVPGGGQPLYWVKFVFNAALDSSTTLNALTAMNRSTNYASLVSGRVAEFLIPTGTRKIGCIEAITDAGTAALIVNVATMPGSRFG